MISIESTAPPERPLYLCVKPPAAALPELRRLRASLGIESRYAIECLHNTFLVLGEASAARIDAARNALASFHAEPFEVSFDHVEGATLKPRKGPRAPGLFQRALARHFAWSGLAPPEYDFRLHLNLDYLPASDRRAAIAPLAWTVEEILLVESASGRHVVHARRGLVARQYTMAL